SVKKEEQFSRGDAMAKRFICSMPNPNCQGNVHPLFYTDTPEGHALAETLRDARICRGRAVYDAINIFEDAATRRTRETVVAIDRLASDIDTKDIEESVGEVIARLKGLRSGHGAHVINHLKEPVSTTNGDADAVRGVRTRMTEWFCADTALLGNHLV